MKSAYGKVKEFHMFDSGDHVLAGVSGGPDSVALLLFLLDAQKEFSLNIAVAHLNHMLRGREADRDEAFVRSLADKFGLPCHIKKIDVAEFSRKNRLSTEEGGRNARYSFLKDIQREHRYSKIALGHNRDDNAELILMNILRGTGPRGLSGIPPVRENCIVRPFMGITKNDIIKFLEFKGQQYMTDRTNQDNIYLRNSVRNYLFPLIEEKYNPRIKESLIRLSTIIKDENDWMEKEADLCFNQALESIAPDNQCPDTIELSIDAITNCHGALRKRVIRKAIKKINKRLKKISYVHIEDIVKLSLSKTFGESIDLPHQIRVFKQKKSLYFKKESRPLRELGKKRKRSG